jgi:hypothetical protein
MPSSYSKMLIWLKDALFTLNFFYIIRWAYLMNNKIINYTIYNNLIYITAVINNNNNNYYYYYHHR